MSVNAIVAIALFIGFLNNVAISGFFGLNRSIDAYFAAGVLGTLFLNLIVDYVGRNFLPIFSKLSDRSPEEANALASTVVSILTIFAAVTVIILLNVSKPVFDFLLPGFNEEDLKIVTKMFAIQAPAIVFMTVNSVHQYVWQHAENYVRVANARLFIPLSLLFFIAGGYLTQNIYALPAGFLAGHIVSFIVLAYRIPYQFRPTLRVGNPEVRTILGNSLKLTASGLITRLRGPILQYFGSLLGEGAIAATTMALKICAPVHEAALMGVRMIVFSRASQEAGRGNLVRLADLYNYSLSAVLLGVVPVAVWVTFNGNSIVRLVFERGEFTQAMSTLVTLALYGAAPTIIFHGLVQLLSNSFYALQRISIPLFVLPVGTALFFLASKLLSASHGIFGLTLASSIVAGVMTLTLTIALQFVLPNFSALSIFARLTKYTVLAVVFGFLAAVIGGYFSLSVFLTLALTFTIQFLMYLASLAAIRDRTFIRVWRSVNREFITRS